MTIRPEEMTNFTFKIDKKTREEYSELCNIRQAVRSQSMSFSLKDENGFTPSEAAELRRRMADVEKGMVEMHSPLGDDE